MFARGASCSSCPRTSHIAPISTPRAMARGNGCGCCCGPTVVMASSSFHPRSTPQAVAREAGAGGVSFVALSPLRCAPCIIPPAIHPTSSGSWGWGGWCVVCGRCWALRCRCRRSTHDPPHEQLLVRLEVGGVPLLPCVVIIVVPPAFHPTSSCSRGWGQVVVVVAWRCVVVVVPPAIHPTSSCS
jgi:hypothetical protein